MWVWKFDFKFGVGVCGHHFYNYSSYVSFEIFGSKIEHLFGGGGLSRFFFKIPNKPFTCAEFMLCNKSGVERLSTTLDEGPRHARQV